MSKTNLGYIETVIIGGGFSGLFLAQALNKNKYSSFLLVERRHSLGGHAILGGMKLGLLPAGEKTKKLLPVGFYARYQIKFIKEFSKYTYSPPRKRLNQRVHFKGLVNKLYDSLILSREQGRHLSHDLCKDIKDKIWHGEVVAIAKTQNGYRLRLNNRDLECKYLVVASGRDAQMSACLEKVGQAYSKRHDLLSGCRVSFRSKDAQVLFKHQVDFKIKAVNRYQTYCFNHRGNIICCKYKGFGVYSGVLDEKRETGNCFIGKRVTSTPDKELLKSRTCFEISYRKFLANGKDLTKRMDYKGLKSFLAVLEAHFGLRFLKLYFPALEQFWPRPHISYKKLQSCSLPNVYFIGDATGFSYGVVQCYVTAKLLLTQMEQANVFS